MRTRGRRLTRLVLLALGAAVALSSGDALADDPPPNHRAQIESMSPDELATLERRWDRFRALPSKERDRLRQLHRDLAADPQSTELHAVLVRYQQFLKQLSPGQRAELMSLAPERRIKRIARHQAEQRRRDQRARLRRAEVERRALNQPSPGDIDAIWNWLEEFVEENRERILNSVPEGRRAYVEGLEGRRRRMNLMRIAMQRPRGHDGRGRPLVTAANLGDLADRLSPAAREKLAQNAPRGGRNAMLREWIQSAIWTRMRGQDMPGGRYPISQQELEHFFEYDLTTDERANLLEMPRDQMQRELRRLYMQGPSAQRGSGGGRDGGMRDSGGPPRGPGERQRSPRNRDRLPERERRGPPPRN